MTCSLYWNDALLVDNLFCSEGPLDRTQTEEQEIYSCLSISQEATQFFYPISKVHVQFSDGNVVLTYHLSDIIIDNKQCGCSLIPSFETAFSEDLISKLLDAFLTLGMPCVMMMYPFGGETWRSAETCEWRKVNYDDFTDISYYWDKGFKKLKTPVSIPPKRYGWGYLVNDTCGMEYASTKNQFSLQMIFPELGMLASDLPLFIDSETMSLLQNALLENGQKLQITQGTCRRSSRTLVDVVVKYDSEVYEFIGRFVLQDDTLMYDKNDTNQLNEVDFYLGPQYNPRGATFNMDDVRLDQNGTLKNNVFLYGGYDARFITARALSILMQELQNKTGQTIQVSMSGLAITTLPQEKFSMRKLVATLAVAHMALKMLIKRK